MNPSIPRLTLTASHTTSLADLVRTKLGETGALALARGGIWHANARILDQETLLEPGATVTVRTPPNGQYPELTFDPAWIIYEDADLLVINKPPGTYVVETPWDAQANLRVALSAFLAARDNSAYVHPVHRLDRDTSGVLLFSKSTHVNAALQRAFSSHAAHKRYVARCIGAPPAEITLQTGHGRERLGRFRVYSWDEVGRELPGNGGRIKTMITTFRILAQDADSALVEARPHTGRTHQIRLHLAHLGCPIIGDSRYGGPDTWHGEPISHHMLHAAELTLPDPRTGDEMRFCAALPDWCAV